MLQNVSFPFVLLSLVFGVSALPPSTAFIGGDFGSIYQIFGPMKISNIFGLTLSNR